VPPPPFFPGYKSSLPDNIVTCPCRPTVTWFVASSASTRRANGLGCFSPSPPPSPVRCPRFPTISSTAPRPVRTARLNKPTPVREKVPYFPSPISWIPWCPCMALEQGTPTKTSSATTPSLRGGLVFLPLPIQPFPKIKFTRLPGRAVRSDPLPCSN